MLKRDKTMNVQAVFEYLNSLFPVDTACEFDNAGLLIGDPNTEVNRVLVTLDCDVGAVALALEKGCDLIISHHPVIFSPIKQILAGSVEYELIRGGISVISMHTNMDMGENGVNDTLCSVLGLTKTASLTAADGFLLKGGITPQTNAKCFAELIKSRLGGRIKFVDGGRPINKVLVCSGSGGDFIADALSGGFNALVTADVKHHQFLQAKENGISLFDAGHFETEDIIVEPLKEVLKNKFPDLEILTYHSKVFEYV